MIGKVKIYLWVDDYLKTFSCSTIGQYSFSNDEDMVFYVDQSSLPILAKHKLFHFGKECGNFIYRIGMRNNLNLFPDFEIFNGSHKLHIFSDGKTLKVEKCFSGGALGEDQLDWFIQGVRSFEKSCNFLNRHL